MITHTAGIHNMLVRITIREDPDQAASSNLGLHCLLRPFLQVMQVTILYILERNLTLVIFVGKSSHRKRIGRLI